MSRDLTTIVDTARPAARAVIDRDPEANAALVVAAEFMELSARNLRAYFDRAPDERGDRDLLAAHAYGVIAYLLHALHDADQSAASDAAWEVSEMSEDGQALAEWVGDKLAALGLDAGAMPEVTA